MSDTSRHAARLQAKAAVLPTTTILTRPTKKAQLITFLSSKSGADAAEISAKFGWQPHTTRAALSGLRKAGFGVTKESTGAGKPVRYRLVAGPTTAPASTEATNGQ